MANYLNREGEIDNFFGGRGGRGWPERDFKKKIPEEKNALNEKY